MTTIEMKKYLYLILIVTACLTSACQHNDDNGTFYLVAGKNHDNLIEAVKSFSEYGADPHRGYVTVIASEAEVRKFCDDFYESCLGDIYAYRSDKENAKPFYFRKADYDMSPEDPLGPEDEDYQITEKEYQVAGMTATHTSFCIPKSTIFDDGVEDPFFHSDVNGGIKMMRVSSLTERWDRNGGSVKTVMAYNSCGICTGDLNKGCGTWSGFVFLTFQPNRVPSFVDYRYKYPASEYAKQYKDYINSTITGIYLLVASTSDFPEELEIDGHKYTCQEAFEYGNEGTRDLNYYGGGDYLYVYTTTEYTGREYYVVHPDVASLKDTYSANQNLLRTLTYPTVWYQNGGNVPTEQSIYDALKGNMKNGRQVSDYIDFIHPIHVTGSGSNVTLSEPDFNTPGDFNSRADGSYNIFISLPYGIIE